jgi:hypothetical protein
MPMLDRAFPISVELEVGHETDHEKWSEEPIYHNAEANLNPNGSLTKDEMERFVFHFAKNWEHHDE